MIFVETRLAGAYTVDIDRREDNRGHFARVFCGDEFSAYGLNFSVAQASLSFNAKRGTLRGLHFQYPPAAETKYVRCVKGAVFDVIVDLRPESSTYLEHLSVHLSAENGRGLYIPKRFAHGFVTLEENTELSYLIGASHAPNAEGGLRYDDPMLGVEWPLAVHVISERDTAWKPIVEIERQLKSRMSFNEAAYG
ncbi:dTDP-4-dehydrorhamnose 3,5-epimerase family protein [Bradyrhizobium sp. JYMT SZCCT0428]|uniref:dTDP-4-dehydrorhamnose 3,5-epimerase family protein n=1 Tax=Bradyrhizobium sp. JYMT SZCCT0428 TaxID=2807673 RepID=UPI001BA6F302|nr:dTDP-4-dehydrorhamnose 3,5-epimerase family protein [Bradyrhizobium sp. JYMT SZCCT0428]MBR1156032.1 dTDP-4-dehydrorhamnose 3,5-epimerase family protein [Bradyrhizobium sp. JYMT SZCCT0428]